jgi:hypothetical protein
VGVQCPHSFIWLSENTNVDIAPCWIYNIMSRRKL